MRNKNKTVWSNRLSNSNSKNFQRIGASINIDKRLYNEDIDASIVHAQMLSKQKIIPSKDGKKIVSGLKKIRKEIEKNKFKFKEKFEDIHQNIEKRKFEIIGNSAGYFSEGDQEMIK
jgi:Argininosuccinate lyase